jgi:cytochrome c oxidase subunit II
MLYTLANTTQEYADKTLWMPPQAGTFAPEVDWLFYFILTINIFFFVLIATLVCIFGYRYRRSANPAPRGDAIHSTGLELFWSIIPFFVVIYTFYLGFVGYKDMVVAPPNGAYTIIVQGQKWQWNFIYTTPSGTYTDKNLHIPFDRPVKLILKSDDVIHALFIPAFRAKKDVVPGRYNQMWVQAKKLPVEHFDKDGIPTFPIYCAEYCGTSHSRMLASVYIEKDFDAWLKEAANFWVTTKDGVKTVKPWAEVGQVLMDTKGCFACHSIDGSSKIGPTFKGLWAKGEETLSDGSKAKIDETYLRESIEYPNAKIVKGYEGKNMSPYKDQFSPNDFIAINEYIKSLSPGYVAKDPLPLAELMPAPAPAK